MIKINDIFNLGIGFGGSEDFKVIEIKKSPTEEDYAVLEMIDFAGPHQRMSLTYLETLKKDIKG